MKWVFMFTLITGPSGLSFILVIRRPVCGQAVKMKPLIFILLLALCVVYANGSCPPGQLSCDDGKECIDSTKWCDKTEDCTDKSDELYCKKKGFWTPDPNDCDDTHFLCTDGRCIPKKAECNGHSDCKDGSDEDNCEKSEEDETSSEESENSSDKTETSSKDSENSSEDSKKSSEGTKTSKDSENSSEESQESSEESNSNNEDTSITDPLTENNNERPNLGSTQSPPSPTISTFEAAMPRNYDANGYYDISKMTTLKPRTYAPTRPPIASPPSVQGNYYPPPPPTFPKQPQSQTPTPNVHRQLTYNERDRSSQPTVDNRRPPSGVQGNRGQYPDARGQPTSYPTGGRREPNSYTPDYGRREPNSYTPGYGRREPNSSYTPGYGGREPTSYTPGYGRREPTSYTPGYGRREPTSNSPDYDRRQSSYSSIQGGRQLTYHLPTPSRQQPYNNPSHYLSPYVPRYTGHRKVLPRFNFSRDLSNHKNYEFVSRGVDWILRHREPYKGWGVDTPRAIVALSLAKSNYSFGSDPSMKTFLNLQVGLKLLKPENLRVTELAHIILALMATCQDPSDFQGVDIGRTLMEKGKNHHPFTLLTGCLAGQALRTQDLNTLVRDLYAIPNTEKKKDRLSLSISAFSCYLRSVPSEQTRLGEVLHQATSALLEVQLDDGSFGSVYSTAIAVQALMSLNSTLSWNPEPAFNFLREHQNINGSFGDFMATYYVIPALSGRSLLHLRNTCTPQDEELSPQEILEYAGEKQYLTYSLHFGYPLSNAYSVQMHVPIGISFFDVMRVAEYQNKHFKFQYDIRNEKINVYSISDVPNDPERSLTWHLYEKTDRYYNIQTDVRSFLPRSNGHYVFWYHHYGIHPLPH